MDQQTENLKQEVRLLSMLVNAGKRLANISNPANLFTTFGTIVRETNDTNSSALFLYDKDSETLNLVDSYNWDEDVSSIRVEPGDFPPEIFQGEPFLTKNGTGRLCFPKITEGTGLDDKAFCLWVPINHEDNLLALLGLGQKVDGLQFFEKDLECYKCLASLAGFNFHNSLLFERERQEKKKQSQTIRNLSLLFNIGRALNHMNDLKQLLRYILRQAILVSKAQKGSIMLYDSQADCLQVRVIEGLEDRELMERINNSEAQTKKLRPGEGVAGTVFKTGKPMIINDIAEDTRFVEAKNSFAQSIACIPMLIHNDIIGVINVTNKEDGSFFADNEVELLKAISDQAAVAINRAQLWEMAVTDSLTGLYIRRYFLTRLTEELQRCKRYGKTFSIIMADVDHFKRTNDTYGHAAGDEVLKSLTRFLVQDCRDVDIIARYGGEEFVLLLPETDKEGAVINAERLRDGVAKIEFDSMEGLTISMGISTYPDDAQEVEDLITKADQALYQAKRAGRDCVVAFSGTSATGLAT